MKSERRVISNYVSQDRIDVLSFFFRKVLTCRRHRKAYERLLLLYMIENCQRHDVLRLLTDTEREKLNRLRDRHDPQQFCLKCGAFMHFSGALGFVADLVQPNQVLSRRRIRLAVAHTAAKK